MRDTAVITRMFSPTVWASVVIKRTIFILSAHRKHTRAEYMFCVLSPCAKFKRGIEVVPYLFSAFLQNHEAPGSFPLVGPAEYEVYLWMILENSDFHVGGA